MSQAFSGLQWGHAHSRVETWAFESEVINYKPLQWGHAHSRVETKSSTFFHTQVGAASMGPRAFTRGDLQPAPNCYTGCGASMGPRAFTRGDPAGLVHRVLGDQASMGPRAFTRGDTSPPKQRTGNAGASMGPRAFTRGDGATSNGVTLGLRCFNGATRIHAWRQKEIECTVKGRSCFNGATRIHAWRPPEYMSIAPKNLRFNGATRIHAWRRGEDDKPLDACFKLQWGHAHSRVETCYATAQPVSIIW